MLGTLNHYDKGHYWHAPPALYDWPPRCGGPKQGKNASSTLGNIPGRVILHNFTPQDASEHPSRRVRAPQQTRQHTPGRDNTPQDATRQLHSRLWTEKEASSAARSTRKTRTDVQKDEDEMDACRFAKRWQSSATRLWAITDECSSAWASL